MPLDPQAQRLQALGEQERTERTDGGADVAQVLDAQLRDVGRRAERLTDDETVVALIRFGESREFVAVGGVVEGAGIDHDTSDRRSVPADVLRGRVDDGVHPVFERVEYERRGDGVVNDEWDAHVPCDRTDGIQVEDVALRVADRFAEECLCVRLSGGPPLLRVIGLGDEGDRDAELLEGVTEQAVGPSVQAGAGHDVVACFGDVRQRAGRCRLSGREQQRADAALERGQPLLDDVLGRVDDAGVDVARFGQPEQGGRVIGVPELERRRLVDRQGPCAGGRIRGLTGMDLLGLEGPLFAHGDSWEARRLGWFGTDDGVTAKPSAAGVSASERPGRKTVSGCTSSRCRDAEARHLFWQKFCV